MHHVMIIFSLICWINIGMAAPLNKFVAPPQESSVNYPAAMVQQQTAVQPFAQQQQNPTLEQRILPPKPLTLQQRWEQLRIQNIDDKTKKMIEKLKTTMQTLNLDDKMAWHQNFKKKYNKAQKDGEDMAKGYYQKLITVSEQLIGQDILKEKQQ